MCSLKNREFYFYKLQSYVYPDDNKGEEGDRHTRTYINAHGYIQVRNGENFEHMFQFYYNSHLFSNANREQAGWLNKNNIISNNNSSIAVVTIYDMCVHTND